MTARSPCVNIHATSVVLARAMTPFGGGPDCAVLLIGTPGAGKSDVALRLIAMGAKLLSDDRTDLVVENGRLIAQCPPSLHGQIEIRGIGIARLESAGPAPVVLAVVLDPEARIERLPEARSYPLPEPLQVLLPPPMLTLRPFEAATPAKIAACAAALSRGGFVAGAGRER